MLQSVVRQNKRIQETGEGLTATVRHTSDERDVVTENRASRGESSGVNRYDDRPLTRGRQLFSLSNDRNRLPAS
jgi:hypothetical protein